MPYKAPCEHRFYSGKKQVQHKNEEALILLNILAHDTLNEQADAPGWIFPVVLAVVVIAFVAIGAVILKGIMRDSGDTSQRAAHKAERKIATKTGKNLGRTAHDKYREHREE